MKQLNIDETTGFVAIGSVIVSGGLLIIHAFIDMKLYVEYLYSLAVWHVAIAVPLLFLSYITGMVTVKLCAWGADIRRGENAESYALRVVTLSKVNCEFISNEYSRLSRQLEFFQGSCFAIGILVLGIATKVCRCEPDIGGRLEWGRTIFIIADAFLIGLILLLWALAQRVYAKMVSLNRRIQNPDVEI
ncbi:MAG: hypothetical protein JXR76_06900 [Deltaproteobacteria bacterium]|nr:hypothetical protein [Deltaproteobacteria bacterium]